MDASARRAASPGPRDRQRRGEPEAVVSDIAREVHALGAELGNCLLDVVAHQRDLVVLVRRPGLAAVLVRCRMHPELRRAGSEDQPPPGVDVRPAEHVPEERPRRLGVVGVDQRVHGGGVRTAVSRGKP